MSSFPCKKAAHRPEGCPPLSDSEDSDEETVHKISNESINEVYQNDVSSLAKSSVKGVKQVKDVECWFVDRSAIQSTRTTSITKMQTEAERLQKQIEEIKLEKERIQVEIRQKKKQMIEAIEKVIELEDSIESVEALIADKLHHFQTRLIDLETKRWDIFSNSGDTKVRQLLESEIDEVKEEFNKRSKFDETEMSRLIQTAQTSAVSIGDVVELYQHYVDESIADALSEESPTKLKEMKENLSKNMEKLHRLINRPAQFCKDKAGKRFYLNVNMERVYKAEAHSSEYKLNVDCDREKIKDGFTLAIDGSGEFYVDFVGRKIYTKYYFEDENGRYYIDVHGSRFYKSDPEASEYILVNGDWKKIKDGTYPVDERGLRIIVKPANEKEMEVQVVDLTTSSDLESDLDSDLETGLKSDAELDLKKESKKKKVHKDDLKYIKEAVGPAIRKGLVAVALFQPADPIDFFANFLLNYRYKKQSFEKQEQELNHFLDLRDKLSEEPNVSECN